jgi:two-component system chemotaxis sensor kinase CheA
MKISTLHIKYILWVGTAIPIILIILISLLTLNQFSAFQKNNQWVDHTHEVLIKAHQIEKLIVDMETGQRGFIITGDINFLKPFHQASSSIFSVINDLKIQVNDNPIQVVRLQTIENKVTQWLKVSGNLEIDARKEYDRGEIKYKRVIELLTKKTGKNIIDSLRSNLTVFISLENELILGRKNEVTDDIVTIKIISFLAILIVAVVGIITGSFTSNVITEKNWVTSKQSSIISTMHNASNFEDLSKLFLNNLFPLISAQIGALYVSLHGASTLQRVGSYGLNNLDMEADIIYEGEGLIGQCLSSGETMQIRDFPNDYFTINSSLGSAKPTEISIFPIKNDSKVIAVIELASFVPLSRKEKALLASLLRPLGIIINKVLANKRTNELLRETQAQAKYLSVQQAEIQDKNIIAERERNKAIAANASKTEFLANMSHELRTPVHIIVGFSDLGIMNTENWSNDEQIENLNEIKSSGARLLTLINGLLDLSKLEARVIEFNFNNHDLQIILAEVVRSLSTLIDDKSLNINLPKTEISTFVECDYDKIFQVITNLISNAIKFTPFDSNIKIHIEESTLSFGEHEFDKRLIPAISLSIIDQGIGIPEDELETIFDKFVQSSKTKTGAGGTGLGLSICKEVIEGHMGEIWVESGKESSASFTFTIPLKQKSQEK